MRLRHSMLDPRRIVRNQCPVDPIVPRLRKDPFDDPAWTFEPKLDGFRGIADTIHGRILSRKGNRFSRFDDLLETLPDDVILDGEIVVLDNTGQPSFADLMRREGQPIYVAFEVLSVRGDDVRPEPLENGNASSPSSLDATDFSNVNTSSAKACRCFGQYANRG
jgi:bifunctional non-homologous end joining protein LigD